MTIQTKATATLATAVALLLLAVALPSVHAQAPCNMFCPIGAGVTDSFSSASQLAHADALAAQKQQQQQPLRGAKSVLATTAAGGSGAAPVLAMTAQVDFTIPAVPLNTSTSVTSTLFSAIQAFYGSDVYQGVATLSFDASRGTTGAWTLQALIQHNGLTVASGAILQLQPGHIVTSTIIQPTIVGQPMQVQMADPYQGFSQAVYWGIPPATADSNEWLVGWGWDGVNNGSGGADCSLLPPGGSLLLNQIVAYDTNQQPIPLNFTAATTMQPFCQLAATSDTQSMQPATVTFTWSNN